MGGTTSLDTLRKGLSTDLCYSTTVVEADIVISVINIVIVVMVMTVIAADIAALADAEICGILLNCHTIAPSLRPLYPIVPFSPPLHPPTRSHCCHKTTLLLTIFIRNSI